MTGKTYENLIEPYKVDLNQKEDLTSLIKNCDPKIIAFYAEKGGVGKTTLCLTLAHTLAATGKRVLIYDCDVQRSLTAWTFGINIELHAIKNPRHVNILDNIYTKLKKTYDGKDFKDSLYEQVNSDDLIVKPAHAVKIKENLYLVCGDRNTPILDEKIANTEAMTSEQFTLMHMPNQKSAKPYYSIVKTAQHYKVDYVFLDMNPYPGILNRCLLMSSHYIVIPAVLDFFCEAMMNMMRENLENWNAKTKNIINSTNRQGGAFPWPDHKPKFLGYIISIFMLYPESMPLPSESSMRNDWASVAGTSDLLVFSLLYLKTLLGISQF